MKKYKITIGSLVKLSEKKQAEDSVSKFHAVEQSDSDPEEHHDEYEKGVSINQVQINEAPLADVAEESNYFLSPCWNSFKNGCSYTSMVFRNKTGCCQREKKKMNVLGRMGHKVQKSLASRVNRIFNKTH